MPIPPFLDAGLLPDGIHECTVDEIVERFGAFQESDRRPTLAKALRAYIDELRAAGVGKFLVVNGSFVTDKARPGDIDLLLILREDIDLAQPVPPFQYNARSKRYVRKNYGFDFFVGFDNDPSSEQMLALFREVKNRPGAVKGYLKVVL